jgi:hypothetical protein
MYHIVYIFLCGDLLDARYIVGSIHEDERIVVLYNQRQLCMHNVVEQVSIHLVQDIARTNIPLLHMVVKPTKMLHHCMMVLHNVHLMLVDQVEDMGYLGNY